MVSAKSSEASSLQAQSSTVTKARDEKNTQTKATATESTSFLKIHQVMVKQNEFARVCGLKEDRVYKLQITKAGFSLWGEKGAKKVSVPMKLMKSYGMRYVTQILFGQSLE